jgi:hypothetical protein
MSGGHTALICTLLHCLGTPWRMRGQRYRRLRGADLVRPHWWPRGCRLISTVFALAFFTSSCATNSTSLSEETIWRGYAAILAAETGGQATLDPQALDRFSQQYTFTRHGPGSISVPNPQQTDLCLPDALRNRATPVEGQSIFVRILDKAETSEVMILEFVRWQGTNEWWVSRIERGSRCILIDDSP